MIIGWLVLALGMSVQDQDLTEWVDRLGGGRFESISEARLAILDSPAEEARAALRAGLRAESPRVRARSIDLLAVIGDDQDLEVVLERMREEPDPEVQERLVWAAARLGDAASEMVARLEAGTIRPELFEIYQRERLLLLLQATLRDGSIPGFYDGQFDSLSALGPGLVDQLFEIGSHPSLSQSLRGMAVAAIGSHGTFEDVLRLQQEFMIDPGTEIEQLTDRASESKSRSRAQLSQYARWASWRLGEKVLPLEPIRELERRIAQERNRYSTKKADYLFHKGYGFLRLRLLDEAEATFREYVRQFKNNPGIAIHLQSVHYNLACIHALRSEVDPAIRELRNARAEGFTDMGWLLEDRDLEKIRQDPKFRKFLEEQ